MKINQIHKLLYNVTFHITTVNSAWCDVAFLYQLTIIPVYIVYYANCCLLLEVSRRTTEKCHLRWTVSSQRERMNNGTCTWCPPVQLSVCMYVSMCVRVAFGWRGKGVCGPTWKPGQWPTESIPIVIFNHCWSYSNCNPICCLEVFMQRDNDLQNLPKIYWPYQPFSLISQTLFTDLTIPYLLIS